MPPVTDARLIAEPATMPHLPAELGFAVNVRTRRGPRLLFSGAVRPAMNGCGSGLTCERIVERLHARRSGSGWIACCPAHEDRSPSLSICEGEDSRVLLHCFSGCSIESICHALEIKVSDLFPKPGAIRPKPSAVRDAERQIQGLRNHLTPRERILPVIVVYIDPENLEAGIARALALAVEGEIVQAVLGPTR
jgi:hypothetical protein